MTFWTKFALLRGFSLTIKFTCLKWYLSWFGKSVYGWNLTRLTFSGFSWNIKRTESAWFKVSFSVNVAETKKSDLICLESTTSNRNPSVLFAYHSANLNRRYFLNEMSKFFNKVLNKYITIEDLLLISTLTFLKLKKTL